MQQHIRCGSRVTLTSIVLLASALFAGAISAQESATPQIQARSEVTVTVAGKRLAIAAEAGLVPVASKPGHVDATAGYICYIGPSRAHRPVLFIFNGGPGAASAYLQMGAFGPMRTHVPQDPTAPLPAQATVAENPETLLDIADLVFLDPPGTGFSSIAENADRSFYQSVKGDADAVAQAAQAWLVAHGRTAAPLYILGESYGTIRAAAMVDALRMRAPGLEQRGVLLLGQALNMIETSQPPDNVVTYPVSLPTMSPLPAIITSAPAAVTPRKARPRHRHSAPSIWTHCSAAANAMAPRAGKSRRRWKA